jgi:hypothetical protein
MRALLSLLGFVLLVTVFGQDLQSASRVLPVVQSGIFGEPQSLALGGLGLILIGVARRRRRSGH